MCRVGRSLRTHSSWKLPGLEDTRTLKQKTWAYRTHVSFKNRIYVWYVPYANPTSPRPNLQETRRALGRAHVSPTKVFPRLAVNKTILKPRLAAATGVGFSRRNKIPRCSAYTISEKEIRFWHPVYNPDRAQKLISSSMSRHLSTLGMCRIHFLIWVRFLEKLGFGSEWVLFGSVWKNVVPFWYYSYLLLI